MGNLIFWDIDTLYDFMRADGKLYVPGSEAIIPALRELTKFAHDHGIQIVASADNHSLSDSEISDSPDWRTTFPAHCMQGTPGQLKIAETQLRNPLIIEPVLQDPAMLRRQLREHRGDILLHKQTLDIFTNANVPLLLEVLEPEAVVMYGVATDFCDRYVVEGLLRELPQAKLYLVVDAIRPIYPEEGERLIAHWRDRGVRMVTAEEVLRGDVLASRVPTAVRV
jgi:nicotinamidase/pyrazinamidase